MSVRRIAKLVGVSPSTVSLALKKSPKIPAETRRKVEEVARRLGYSPNVKVTELMSHVRLSTKPRLDACFAVISFYEGSSTIIVGQRGKCLNRDNEARN